MLPKARFRCGPLGVYMAAGFYPSKKVARYLVADATGDILAQELGAPGLFWAGGSGVAPVLGWTAG